MTRSPKRICTAVFAVFFALCTIVSTGAALLAVPAQAAEGDTPAPAADDTITITGITATVDGNTIDLADKPLRNGAEITDLHIEISHPDTIADAPTSTTIDVPFKFTDSNFRMKDETAKATVSKWTAVTGGCTYTLIVKDVSYTSTGDYRCAIEYGNALTPTAFPILPFNESSEGLTFKLGPNIYHGNSIMGGKMTRGNRYTVDLLITDENFDAAEFETLRVSDQIKINLNTDFFSSWNKPIINKAKTVSQGIYYTVKIENAYYTGTTDNLVLEVLYGETSKGAASYRASDRCELYVRDNDRNDRDDDDDDSSSRPDIAPPTPNIIVSKFDYGGGSVRAAGNFSLEVTLTNTSQKLPIDNIVMKVTVPEAFTMNNSSNTFYIEKLSRNSSVKRRLDLSVKPNADPISHPIKFSFAFETVISEARKQLTSEEEISIPVAQLDRFSLETVEVPPEIFVGEDMGISVNFVNKGKTTVYNVTAEIMGNITQPGQRQFIGNVESGKEDSADFLIGAIEAGTIEGEILITYEDANMNVGELRSPFSATGIQMNMDPGGMETMNPEELPPPEPAVWYAQIPVWAYVVGGVGVSVILAFITRMVRAHRERKMLEDDDDEDI